LATGRTSTKWIRFAVTDKDGDPREIPIDSLSPVGFSYDETELTAWQDAVKGYLTNHPDCSIDITGPFDSTAEVALAIAGDPPALTGSFTVLQYVNTAAWTDFPMGLWIAFGIRDYWDAGDPAFGVDHPGLTNGYVCTKFQIEGEKYSARFTPFPGSTPEWDDEILADWA
jgi:hypothetical protein